MTEAGIVMMSVRALMPLLVVWVKRSGSEPKMVAGLQRNPTAGRALMSSPHQSASTAS
ncbi:MAG: hypothetical protein IPN47_12445 [Gemmatimonadetes bacterium]|nr:hypothetical protein [Gemmatimonadota bacterium]